MNLKNKTVVITGADGGMGSIICKSLAEEGANLALCSNNQAQLEELVKSLSKSFPDSSVIYDAVDVTNEADVVKFIKKAADKFGKFDLLLNLAGLSIPTQYDTAEESAYDIMMDVNVKGAFLMSKHFAEFASSPSRIVNIGSMAARNTNANAPIYCMAKAAVNKLSEGLLLQFGKKGIAVSTINPGGTDTAFWGNRAVDRTKLMDANDVAQIILFVAHLSEKIQLHSIDFESSAKFM